MTVPADVYIHIDSPRQVLHLKGAWRCPNSLDKKAWIEGYGIVRNGTYDSPDERNYRVENAISTPIVAADLPDGSYVMMTDVQNQLLYDAEGRTYKVKSRSARHRSVPRASNGFRLGCEIM